MKRYGPPILLVATLAIIYHGWLNSGAITFGDWGYYSTARMQDFWPVPSFWDGSSGTGSLNPVSGPAFPLLFLHGLLTHLGFNFAISERVIWIFPSVLISALSTYALAVTFFSSRMAAVVSGLFVVTNTYTRLLLTGGQFTVAGATAMMPLVLLLYYRALQRPTLHRFALTALCMSIQTMYDPRTTYITVGVLCLFTLFYLVARRTPGEAVRTGLHALGQGVVAAGGGVLILAYWLLPVRIPPPAAASSTVTASLPAGYDSSGWVRALSYMQMSHAITLFHPWGYAIGVPTLPVDPLFYLLPLLLVAVLLKRRVTFVELFLIALALVSIFLVKGSNPPAGDIYLWLFHHLPGFSVFRDPSKFYQPLALAYALLLGRTAILLPLPRSIRLPRPGTRAVRAVMPAIGLGVIAAHALPVAANSSWGTLAPVVVPADYRAFDRYVDSQPQFFRIMWISGASPFASSSSLHPSIDAGYLGDPETWRQPHLMAVLRALSVKYVVVAEDLASRSHSQRALQQVRLAFRSLPELRIGRFHLFLNRSFVPAVFVPAGAITSHEAHALQQRNAATTAVGHSGVLGEYQTACATCLTVTTVSPTRYVVTTRNISHPFLLVLNQSFDPDWLAYVEPSTVSQPFWWTWRQAAVPARFHVRVNGFANAWLLNAPGSHRIILEFWPQRFTDIGFFISWLTTIACAIGAVIPWLRRRG